MNKAQDEDAFTGKNEIKRSHDQRKEEQGQEQDTALVLAVNDEACQGPEDTAACLEKGHGQAGLYFIAAELQDNQQGECRNENILRKKLKEVNAAHTEKGRCP